MVELDGDDVVLTDSNGKETSRDIGKLQFSIYFLLVQFVKFNDFKHIGMHALTEQVLEEIPEQVCSFLYENKIAF